MQQLINYIKQFVELDLDAIDALHKFSQTEKYSKNEFILEQGQWCSKIWYVVKGMIRKFHLYAGKEITSWVYLENDTFTSLQSYSQNLPSEEFLQACEETELISINKENSTKLAKFTAFVEFSNVLMERQFVNNDRHQKELSHRDAKGRYKYICEIAPEMVKRAKLGHIASIIGVSQETLSRVRKA